MNELENLSLLDLQLIKEQKKTLKIDLQEDKVLRIGGEEIYLTEGSTVLCYPESKNIKNNSLLSFFNSLSKKKKTVFVKHFQEELVHFLMKTIKTDTDIEKIKIKSF